MTSGAVKGSDTDNTAHHSAKDPKVSESVINVRPAFLLLGTRVDADRPQTSCSGTFLSWPGPSSVRGYSVELLFPDVSVLPYFLFYFGSLLSSVCCTQFYCLVFTCMFAHLFPCVSMLYGLSPAFVLLVLCALWQ